MTAAALVPLAAVAAELHPGTVAAYERYIGGFEQKAGPVPSGATWFDAAPASMLARLRDGEVVSWAGHEDGIIGIPDGLIHHWRGVAFIPGVSVEAVVAAASNYPGYPDVYEWVLDGHLIKEERDAGAGRSRFWALLRLERSAGVVSSIIDVWTEVEYRDLGNGIATSWSNADCVRQVEDAGGPNERRLPIGLDSGYLWRANTYATYLQRDDGVYVDLQTIGLSRGFPPLLGWIIEPIARRIGRGSASESLERLRTALTGDAGSGDTRRQPGPDKKIDQSLVEWCGD